MSVRICRGVPERTAESRGDWSSTNLRSLRRRNGFVVERFAKAIGKIAVVGFEGVGKRIAFGFEHQSHALVIVQHLIDRRSTAIGRNEKRS